MTTFTTHAKQRRKQMRLTEDQVRLAISNPDSTYPGGCTHPPNRLCYQRGEIVAVVDQATDEIVTVLFHGRFGRD